MAEIEFTASKSEERIFGDKIRMLIDEVSSEFRISPCAAAGIVARVLTEPDVSKMPAEFTKTLENSILAVCTGSNEYMFR
jgi:hypothetical protein